MSVPIAELTLAAVQIAMRYLEFAERAQAGGMTEAEIAASWNLLEGRKDQVRDRLQRKIAAKKGESA